MKTCDYTYRNDGARSSRPAPIYGLSGTISRPPARGSTVERNEKKGGSVIEALDPDGGESGVPGVTKFIPMRLGATRNRGFRFAWRTE